MDVAGVLLERWDLKPTQVEALTGGMNSAVWLAAADGWRVVVKSVDAADESFAAGLELAARLADAGLVTGRPVPSKSRQTVERVEDRLIGVLEYVGGQPLTGTVEDQRTVGDLLGRVHRVSATPPGELEDWLHLVTQLDEYLDLEEWIRPAVEGALEGVRALDGVSWAWLHGDPAAEAFLRQPDGEVALIDWGSAMRGPLLYDVASAVMYAGGAPDHVVPAYLDQRPGLANEVETGLTAFLRIRWAVQAAYFAWRCSNDIRTGIADPAENREGLDHARRAFDAADY
ncbi:homoserine kinase type II [Kribbella sp. VKM Ac-2527]|uniref:Homoserine kinase type II n=1 Tax=Kribbella caucasensis TaxID=2512215 RepID=A0A4R6KPX3_9ACTN|nr:phosphotransferase [Kribbella sp. VKM Ac-2527]TDO54735.1 homoserine kinase type II [Kribbella sp. VKM Ac-2527]